MEAAEHMTPEFWQSEQCHVMVNPRDLDAVEQAGIIEHWAENEPSLSGHVLFATSGTMGGRKWVALSKGALLASARMVNEHLSVQPGDHWLLALPDFHVGGMGVIARSYQQGCSLTRMSGPWDAQEFHSLAQQQGITLASLVPTQIFDIVEAGIRAPESMRALIVGGGRLDDGLYERAMAYGWPLIETYGMTESCSQIATSNVGERDLKVLAGWQTKVTTNGQLGVKGNALLTAYVTCRDGHCSMHDPKLEGWFVTGDLVEMNHETLVVKGRVDRCVKVVGELVNLDEIQDEVRKVSEGLAPGEAVQGVSVIALQDARKGCQLILCAERGGDPSELLKRYNALCHPAERIDELLVVDEIPRGALGKVHYAKLEEWADEQLQT
ncbi:MAG: AMP-binding protein [Akkermansiaceae bacterium]